MNYNIEKLIRKTNLGNKIITVDKVTGGLSHRMYKVVTDKGIYAVKKLNPNVMKRSIFKFFICRKSNRYCENKWNFCYWNK